MTKTWSVEEAKENLTEVLRRASAGEPQLIGVIDACVVVSARVWAARSDAALGWWLVSSAPRGAPVPAAERGSRRGDPFREVGEDEQAF